MTYWHTSNRHGRGTVTVGRGCKHRNMHCCQGMHQNPSLNTCITPRACPWPQDIYIFPCLCQKRPRKTGQIQGTCQQEHKTSNQIKTCVPSLLKQKWRSEIQLRFSILHATERDQPQIICPQARAKPGGTPKLHHYSKAPEYRGKHSKTKPIRV